MESVGAIEVVSKLRMCELKEDLNAEDAEVFREGAQRSALLCVPLRKPLRPLR